MSDHKCPKCKAPLRADNVNIARGLGSCAECQAVFSLEAHEPEALPKPTVELPKGMSLDQLGHEFALKRRWFSPMAIFMVIFCILWDGFMVVWFSIAASQKEGLMAAAGSLHLLVGIGVTYWTVCLFFNTTVMLAED